MAWWSHFGAFAGAAFGVFWVEFAPERQPPKLAESRRSLGHYSNSSRKRALGERLDHSTSDEHAHLKDLLSLASICSRLCGGFLGGLLG